MTLVKSFCTLREKVCRLFHTKFTECLSFIDNKGGFENVLEEIAELRREVSFQNDYINSLADPFKRQGYWYFMPPPPPSSKVGILNFPKESITLVPLPSLGTGAKNIYTLSMR